MGVFQYYFVLLLSGVLLMATAPSAKADTTFTFQLSRAGHTSAGVYNSTGKLVRTLWSDAVITGTAPFTAAWDNLDDYGVAAPAGTYTIKVLGHNVNYVWEGIVGNTSDYSSGTKVHAAGNFPTGLSFSGTTGCYSIDYAESGPCYRSFSTASPQQVTKSFCGNANGGNIYSWYFSDADSSQVYFACPSTQATGTTAFIAPGAVCKFNPVTGAVAAFTSGTTLYAQYTPFINAVHVGTQPGVSGLAVQKLAGSTLLAVSVATDNLVYLLDKTSGSVVRSFAVASPGALAMDNNDNLWVASGTSVYQYSNLSSTPTLTGTVTGSGTTALVAPLGMAVSPATASQPNLLLITDGGTSQQVKAYDMSGVWQWTLGQANGYTTDPAVTSDKFWFWNPEARRELASIAFQPDGTFWVVDTMNDRMMHFQLGSTAGALPTYQNYIGFYGRLLEIALDSNNPTRLFASAKGRWLEYAVDYSLALGGTNISWTLVKNWGHAAPLVSGSTYVGTTSEGFRAVSTLSNGRTYAIVTNLITHKQEIVELPSTGQMRFTGITTTAVFLYGDGSLRYQTVAGTTSTFQKQTLTGFDGSGNPIWSGTTTIATAPAVTGTNPKTELNGGGPRIWITPSNKLVFFDNTKNQGMHLGGIDLNTSTTQWAWEAAPGIGYGALTDVEVPFWGDGSYDIFSGIHYAGGLHDIYGSNIIYIYKGENWAASEASQFMHFNEDGLFIGQYGVPGTCGGGVDLHLAGCAGNVMTSAMASVGGRIYFYVNDETQHSGIHRWRIDGCGTIAELTGSGSLDSTFTLAGAAPIGTAPTVTGVPGAVTGFTAIQNNGSVFLQWTGTNALYYQIRRSTTSNNAFDIIATGQYQPCFTDTSVTNGQTYYYKITPVNENGAGPSTSQIVATPNAYGNVYEAENGTIVGTRTFGNTLASGNTIVLSSTGSVTINNVNGGLTSGTAALILRYFSAYGNYTSARLTVNGVAVATGTLPKTTPFLDYTINIPLNSGTNNTLVLTNPPNLDKFTVAVDSPFTGTPVPVLTSGTTKLEMEHYDQGGEGIAFHDTGNGSVNLYRAPDKVAVIQYAFVSNGYFIGYGAPGEWLKYTVSVSSAGAYTFTIYAASTTSGNTLHVEDELGNNLTGTMTITNTGGLQTYVANSATVNLTVGTHTLKVVEDSGAYNLDYFTLSR